MKRTEINPVEWGLAFNMSQAEVVEGASKVLRASGQVSVKADAEAAMGMSVVAPGDMRAQMEQAFSCIDGILSEAGMERSNVVFLRFFSTNVDETLANYDVYMNWIGPAGIRPPQTLIGISRLVDPELMIEIEVVAAA